ncbi:MAG: polyphenol oxidase family protein [Bdellovibrionota bacterium]
MKLYYSTSNSFSIPQLFFQKFPYQEIKLQENNLLNQKFAQFPVMLSLENPLPFSFMVKNVHGNVVVNASQQIQDADAHIIASVKSEISQLEQRYLAINTADCLPIVFYYEDEHHFIGGVTHAGWRGLSLGIISNTIKKLVIEAQLLKLETQYFLENLKVFLAPAIFGMSYECGLDVKEALVQHEASLFIKESPLRHLFGVCSDVHNGGVDNKVFPDVQLLGAIECVHVGVVAENISLLRENTYGHSIFPSYRESCHKGYKQTKRLWTHLCLPS